MPGTPFLWNFDPLDKVKLSQDSSIQQEAFVQSWAFTGSLTVSFEVHDFIFIFAAYVLSPWSF